MAKGRNTRALAALGGLGAAAYMLGKQGKAKMAEKSDMGSEDIGKDRLGAAGLDMGEKDTTGDASAGMAKDRLADLERAAPKKRATPARKVSKAAKDNSMYDELRGQDRSIRRGDNSMNDELQGLSRLREDRGDMSETGAERIARKQEAGRDKMVNAYRSAFGFKKGGAVKKSGAYKSGGSVSSASKRADGCAVKGKTRGRMV